MFHCPCHQHAAHARTPYITDTAKEALSPVPERELQRHVHHQVGTAIHRETGRVHAVVPLPSGSKLCGCKQLQTEALSRGAFDVVNVWTVK